MTIDIVKKTAAEAVSIIANAALSTPRQMFKPWVAFGQALAEMTRPSSPPSSVPSDDKAEEGRQAAENVRR